MILFFLIILIIYLILKIAYKSIKNKNIDLESFEDSFKKYRTIQINKSITYLIKENNINDENYNTLSDIYSYMKKPEDNQKSITTKNSVYLTNAYKYYSENVKNNEVITMINNPNMCIFFANNKKTNLVVDLAKDKLKITLIPEISNIKLNLNIGYLYDYELNIIKRIMESCNINIANSNINFIKINLTDIIDTLFVLNTIDIYFYYNTGSYDLLHQILKNDYVIINYNNIDINKLKVKIPFCRIKSILVNRNFRNGIKDQGSNNILLIDNLIYRKSVLDISKEIIEYYSSDVVDVLNSYYKDFLTFVEYTKESSKVANIFKVENFTEQKSLNLKYTINNTVVEDIPNTNINSNFKNITYQLYYKIYTTTDDNKIPLFKNDILNIANDKTESIKTGNELEINGKYYVIDILLDSIIVSKYKLVYEIDINDVLELSKTTSNIDLIKLNKKYNLNNNDLVFILGLNKEGEYNDNTIKIINDNNSDFKDKYMCFEDKSITNQYICEGTKNINGTEKKKYTWDRVCVKNSECDFYMANKNYKNTKGKCINGYCELPLGIERKSFRRYELSENSYPICNGCNADISLKDCCNIQKNDKNLKSPNYVFPNEELNGTAPANQTI